MKRLVPSTPGNLRMALTREHGDTKKLGPLFSKFVSVREHVNAFIANWDCDSNPVVSVSICYTFPVERK